MQPELATLLNLLKLKKINESQFIGESEHIGLPQVYGGQVIGQALSAAKNSLISEKLLHSFHCYFLRRGNPSNTIQYEVENIRDGKSYSTRRVSAIQDNSPIFYLTASYQRQEKGLEHQHDMPSFPGPDGLLSETQLIHSMAKHLPKHIVDTFGKIRPIEVRPVRVNNPLAPQSLPPKQAMLIKANGQLKNDLSIHQSLLAYASDWGFLTTALQPHGLSLFSPQVQIATLDHAMWFHREFKFDEWLLFVIDSPSTAGARGFVRGEFFDQQGRLVASATQEGVIRKLPS